MAKSNLNRERLFMDFVESCTDLVFQNTNSLDLYFEKSLFIRICAGQKQLKTAYINGYEGVLLEASYKGPQFFFNRTISIVYKIPLVISKAVFKIKFSIDLFLSLMVAPDKQTISQLKEYRDISFLSSDLSRLTERFIQIVKEKECICEVHSDNSMKIITAKGEFLCSLPRLQFIQFLKILVAPSWKMSYLIRAYRQYNFIKKYDISNVYVMDGDSPGSVSSAYAAHLNGSISTCIQWGAMPVRVKPGYKIFPFNHYLCTGKYYVDLLSPFSEYTRFSVKPRIKKINTNMLSHDRAGSLLFLLEDSPTIITKQESDELIEICIKTKQHYPSLNITARPHPRMILAESVIKKLKEMNITVDSQQNADIAMASHKYVIGHMSSMMIECLEYDCLPIFKDIGLANLQPELVKLSAAKIFKSKSEWFGMLDELIKGHNEYIPPSELKLALFNQA